MLNTPKIYAKVRDDQLIKFPYGFDELQAEFTDILRGTIDIADRFQESEAYQQGYRLAEVEPAPKPQYFSLKYYIQPQSQPQLVEGKWLLGWDVLEIPIAYPSNGVWTWNVATNQWEQQPIAKPPGVV